MTNSFVKLGRILGAVAMAFALVPAANAQVLPPPVGTVNHAPVATNDSVSVPLNSVTTLYLLANDIDEDGDSLTITSTTNPSVLYPPIGSVSIFPDGKAVSFAASGCGTDTFMYAISDGMGGTAGAAVSVTVTCQTNTAPVPTRDTFIDLQPNQVHTLNVLANDIDADNDPLSISSFTQPFYGSVIANADNTALVYRPNAGWCGTDRFSYSITDGNSVSPSASVSVTVACATNTAPVAENDYYQLPAAAGLPSPLTMDLLGNDSDADGDVLSIHLLTQPTYLLIPATAEGSTGAITAMWSSSASGWCGQDSFTYQANDGQAMSEPATVTVNVECPVSNICDVYPDESLYGTQTYVGWRGAGQALNNPDCHTVNILPGTLYHPSFYSSLDNSWKPVWTVHAGQTLQGADRDLSVVALGKGPTTGGLPANNPIMVESGGAVKNLTIDTQFDGGVYGDSAIVAESGGAWLEGIHMIFRPCDPAVTGCVFSGQQWPGMVYFNAGGNTVINSVFEGSFSSSRALSIISQVQGAEPSVFENNTFISEGQVSDAPYGLTVNGGSFTVSANEFIGMFDAAGAVQVILDPTGETTTGITFLLDNRFDFPAPIGSRKEYYFNNTGVSQIALRAACAFSVPGYASDYLLTMTTRTGYHIISVEGNWPKDGLCAMPDMTSAEAGMPKAIDVLANDSHRDGLSLSVIAASQPEHGSASFGVDSILTYVPVAGYIGSDSLSYTVAASDGVLRQVMVSVAVIASTNTPPVAEDDYFSMPAAPGVPPPLTMDLLENDSDADGDVLSIHLLTQPTYLLIPATAEGSTGAITAMWSSSASGWCGQDSFTYQANDGQAMSDSATVTIDVACLNTPPVAYGDSFSVQEGSSVTNNVTANDDPMDADDWIAGAHLVSEPAHAAIFSFNSNGDFVYQPAVGFTGTDSFTYYATDSKGADSAAATVTITVTPAPRGVVLISVAVRSGSDSVPFVGQIMAYDNDRASCANDTGLGKRTLSSVISGCIPEKTYSVGGAWDEYSQAEKSSPIPMSLLPGNWAFIAQDLYGNIGVAKVSNLGEGDQVSKTIGIKATSTSTGNAIPSLSPVQPSVANSSAPIALGTSTVSLAYGGSLWSAVESAAIDMGVTAPVRSLAAAVAKANGIAVSEWGISGKVDSRSLSAGMKIDISPILSWLKR